MREMESIPAQRLVLVCAIQLRALRDLPRLSESVRYHFTKSIQALDVAGKLEGHPR